MHASKTSRFWSQHGEGNEIREALLVNDEGSSFTKNTFQKLKQKNVRNYIIALICLLFMICIWIAMAEILQSAESNSTHKYSKPYFMVWVVHAGYALNLLPWLPYHFCTKAKSRKTRQEIFRVFAKAFGLHFVSIACGYAWYFSLDLTSVSGNTAIYNSSPIFVFLLSLFLLHEKVTLMKIVAVIFCCGGVVMVSFFGSKSHEEGTKSTPAGYIAVVLSTILYALYEVLYKRLTARTDAENGAEHQHHKNESSIWDAFLFLGAMGLCDILFFWPVIPLLHWTHMERFEVPAGHNLDALIITTLMDATFNLLLLFSISLTSPLFVSVACLLTIPVSLVADLIFHNYMLPPLALVGIGLIAIGFLAINLSEYLALRDRAKRESQQVTANEEE